MVEPGGAGNFVLAAHRLGLDISLLGVMGSDPFGDLAAQALEREGVDTSGLIRQPGGSTTTVVVLVDDASRHVFLGAYGLGAEVVVPPGWYERLKNAAALFVSGYSLHEDRLSRAVLACLEFASTRHVPVYFDPGPQVSGLAYEVIRKVLRQTRVLLLTEDEIPLVAEGKTGLETCRQLLDAGPELICVKRGALGCTLVTREGEFSHPGFPVDVRDTSAAGDSFAAAFIYGSLCGWRNAATAAFANAMGAAKVQKLGSGTRVPNLAEVLEVLQDHDVKIESLLR